MLKILSARCAATALLLAPPALAQSWLPGHGNPCFNPSPLQIYAMCTWDPDGPGPQPPQLTVGLYGASLSDGIGQPSTIARFDGRAWRAVQVGSTPAIWAMGAWNGDLYCGGSNGTYSNGLSSVNAAIARFDGTRWNALGGGAGLGPVDAIFPWSNSLVVGGGFSVVNGNMPVNGVASWTGTSWQQTPAGLMHVYQFANYNGELIAAGNLTSPAPAPHVVRWDGAAWAAWPVQPPNASIEGCAVYNGQLVVAGATVGSSPPHNAYTWDGVAWQPLGANMQGTVGELWVHNGELCASGSISLVNDLAGVCVVRFDGAQWRPIGQGLTGAINAMTPYGGAVAVAGNFFEGSGIPLRGVGLYNGAAFSPLGNGLTPGGGSINALVAQGTTLYAGGTFSNALSPNVAGWNGTFWSAMGDGLDFGGVTALAMFNGNLYAGGSFSQSGGAETSRIAAWGGDAWSGVGGGISGVSVHALCVYNGSLIAGGNFTSAGGAVTRNLARWDGSAWHAMATAIDGNVLALSVLGNDLIIGGAFTTIDGVSASRVARWNGATYSAMGAAAFNGYVQALSMHGGSLVAGGAFTQVGGMPAPRLARWDGGNWVPYTTGVNGITASLGELDGDLLVGGSFAVTNGPTPAVSAYFARWQDHPPCGSADFNCDGDTGTDADIESFFACIAGTCPGAPCNSSADFNGDGDVGTDADIEAFFRVLAGGAC